MPKMYSGLAPYPLLPVPLSRKNIINRNNNGKISVIEDILCLPINCQLVCDAGK